MLWAADHSKLPAALLQRLLAIPAVTVVQLVHDISPGETGGSDAGGGAEVGGGPEGGEAVDLHDTHLETALLDLELLACADHMLGTVYSTFSFAAHARALITPLFSAFLPPEDAGGAARGAAPGGEFARSCVRAAGPEAGLLFIGQFPSGVAHHVCLFVACAPCVVAAPCAESALALTSEQPVGSRRCATNKGCLNPRDPTSLTPNP